MRHRCDHSGAVRRARDRAVSTTCAPITCESRELRAALIAAGLLWPKGEPRPANWRGATLGEPLRLDNAARCMMARDRLRPPPLQEPPPPRNQNPFFRP
jgi:hypothetical protein